MMIKLNFSKYRVFIIVLLFLIPSISFASYFFIKKYQTSEDDLKNLNEKFLIQQEEVKELQEFKDEQLKTEEEKRKQQEESEAVIEQQTIDNKQEAEKIQQCKDKKSRCVFEINALESKIGEKEYLENLLEKDLKKLNDQQPDWENDSNTVSAIEKREKEIKEAIKEEEEIENEIKKLKNGDCKNYEKSCN